MKKFKWYRSKELKIGYECKIKHVKLSWTLIVFRPVKDWNWIVFRVNNDTKNPDSKMIAAGFMKYLKSAKVMAEMHYIGANSDERI